MNITNFPLQNEPHLGVFSILPDEIQLYIFEFLHFRDIAVCMRVCSSWYSLLKENTLWQNLFYYYFPILKDFSPSSESTTGTLSSHLISTNFFEFVLHFCFQ
jgi:hypothetical protein